jgi:hypothetical protein
MATGLIALYALALAGASAQAWAEESGPLARALSQVSGSRMLKDVVRLSGLEFGGRQTGTADDLRSGLWVAERFRTLGLMPALNSGKALNPVVKPWARAELVVVTQIQNSPALELEIGQKTLAARLDEEFLPILDSPSVDVKAPVVFVGYGIIDQELGIDDYAGVSVERCVVLMLRGKPDHYPKSVSQADKDRLAREKGALALLTATGPLPSAYERRRQLLSGAPRASYSLSEDERRLPGAWISNALAETIVSAAGRSLKTVQAELNRNSQSQSFATGVMAHLAWRSWQTPQAFYNFMAMIPGHDPRLRDETVVLGAHRDHFGRQAGLLFPGADDNASGTAVLLEVARLLATMEPKRTILLISFSGEEQGLLGSRLYVREPVRPLAATKAMINVDHAGVGNGRLTVGVTDLDREAVLKAGRMAGLAEKLDVVGFFPGGDHVPFKEAGIPTVTVVTGGPHPDLHRTTDTADKVKPELLEMAARFTLALTWQLANPP